MQTAECWPGPLPAAGSANSSEEPASSSPVPPTNTLGPAVQSPRSRPPGRPHPQEKHGADALSSVKAQPLSTQPKHPASVSPCETHVREGPRQGVWTSSVSVGAARAQGWHAAAVNQRVYWACTAPGPPTSLRAHHCKMPVTPSCQGSCPASEAGREQRPSVACSGTASCCRDPGSDSAGVPPSCPAPPPLPLPMAACTPSPRGFAGRPFESECQAFLVHIGWDRRGWCMRASPSLPSSHSLACSLSALHVPGAGLVTGATSGQS